MTQSRSSEGSDAGERPEGGAELERRLAAGESDAKLLAAVLETSVAAICVLDPSGQIVYANAVAEGILGLEPSDLVRRHYDAPEWKSTALDGGEWTDDQQPFTRVMRTGEPVFDVRHAIEWPNGARKLLSVNGAPIKDAAGEITRLVFSVTDITERVRIEEEARETSRWLRVALGAARMGIWSWDIESDDVRWSDEAARVFGLEPGQLEGTYEAYLAQVHPEDVLSVRESVESTLASQAASFSVEHRHVRPDGVVRWVEGRGRVLRDAAGRAKGVTGTLMDVTQRKRAELALRSSEEAFRTLLETVPSYIVSVGPDRRIRFLNRTLPHLSVNEVVGVDVLEFMAEDSRAAYAAAFRRALETGELQEVEGRALRPGGDTGTFLMRFGPVKKGDAVESVTVVGVDVSQLEHAQEALRESQEQLRTAQRMESVGRLAGGVAHDFNNLLTVVTGCVDLLEARCRDEAELLELIHPIRDAAERGAALTSQLLTFARRQVVRPQTLDLNECIRGAGDMLARLVGGRAELRTDLREGLWPVEIDPGQFEQVLANLVVNARDAMPQRGRITIASCNRSLSPADPGPAEVPAGDWVVVTVEDTGTGIRDDVLPFVFEPFFTTKAACGGTGLGLATCFGITRQAGGQIEVESTPGRGTRFAVFLPRAAAEARVDEVAPCADAILTGSGTVLLVEDDRMVRRVARGILAQAGYELLEASDGAEALRLFRQHPERVSLVITDVVMPRMSGAELARELWSAKPGLPVLFVSGYSSELGSLPATTGEHVRVLQKPYSGKGLTEALGQLRGAGSASS